MASILSGIIANLESGGGAYAGSQPASMVNPTYGQYAGFASQYGSGAAGVDNYAQQVLANNPNATLGDYYAGYVLGTGNPSNPPTLSQLQSQYPSAYNNLVNNAGYSLDTPLSQLTGTTLAEGPANAADGYGANGFNPDIPGVYGGTMPGLPFGGGEIIGGGTVNPSTGTLTGQGAGLNVGALSKNWLTALEQSWSAFLTSVQNWFARGGLILLGVVVIAVAIWALVQPEAGKAAGALASVAE